MMVKNKLEEKLEEMRSVQNEDSRLKIVTHRMFSREKDIYISKNEYTNLVSFINHENYPSIVITDNIDEPDKTMLFYLADKNDLDKSIASIIKTNKIFVDNLKQEMLSSEDRINFPNFFPKLDSINENKAYNFEIIILINDYLQDQEIIKLDKKFQDDDNVISIGELKIFDKKRLNNRLESDDGGATEGGLEQITYKFKFKNPSNAETGINNAIIYDERNSEKTILLTLSADSLIKCFDRYQERIFEKNVRYSINSGSASKSVDNSIKETIKNNPEKFFIFNNGITVVAEKIEDLDINNNTVEIKNFSIVNGAQTVSNLRKFSREKDLADNLHKVYVVAKLIELREYDDSSLVEQITKSSNNQKPVQPRDFKSNAPEMIELKEFFEENDVVLHIKNGDNYNKEKKIIANRLGIKEDKVPNILNDVLGQYIYSLILMEPTKAKQNKTKIFNDEHYDIIFKNSSISNEDKFVAYKFWTRIEKIISELNQDLTPQKFKKLMPVLAVTKNWMISVFWFIWNNTENLQKFNDFDKIEDFKNEKGTFINKKIEDEINVNEKLLKDLLIKDWYKKIFEIYESKTNNKGTLYGHSAFSYKKTFFFEFLWGCILFDRKSEQEEKINEIKNLFS